MTTIESLPASPLPGLHVVDLLHDGVAPLQRFFEANPLYFLAVHGVPAQPDEAHEEIHGALPAGWPYTHKYVFGYRDDAGELQALVNIVSDLLAPGVWHLGTFIVATARHGSGDAHQLYRRVEAWARDAGAQWLRLGVVQGHGRAEAFWQRQGYEQAAVRHGIEMGQRTNSVRVMVKPLHGQAMADYLRLVARDATAAAGRPGTAEHPRALPPFAVRHIDHVVLRVRDLDRCVAFYRDVVGCTVARVRPDLGLVHLRTGTSMIDLVAVDGRLGRHGGAAPAAEGRNVDHLCLRVDPFDEAAIVQHLHGHGLAPRGPAATNFGAEGEGLSLYFEDPEGNVIELKGPSVPGSRGD